MRILMVSALYAPMILGGAERSVTLLAEELVRSGDEVVVVTLHPGEEEIVEERNGVRVYRFPMDNRYWPYARDRKPAPASRLLWHMGDAWNRQAAERFGRVLDQEKPDIVHSNVIAGFSVAVWREVKKRNIRLVHTLRDYYLVCSRSALYRNGATCKERCADCKALTVNRRSASQMVDAVVSISQYVLDRHTERGYFANSAHSIIYNIAGATPQAQQGESGDRHDSLVFGYIGKVEREKGIEVVLDAVSLLSVTGWRLRIAGAGKPDYIDNLKRKYPDSRIEWLGFANAWEFYPTIDVSIISSVWPEPLSRVVIETFAAGKSALCAEAGGIPEIARLGKVVATYPAEDAGALAAAMERALKNPEKWRTGGFKDEDALSLFTSETIASRYRETYQSCLKSEVLVSG